MANKAISELPQAENVNNQDLFVLEQGGLAKKLTAETFITEQGIIDALAEALDGHGGIQSVTLQSLSGRIRTYLITFTDGSATTFQVLDGSTITEIRKTSTAGLVDTYTVYMSDGTTTFFQVRNGQDGSATWDQINSKAPIITETVTGAIANFPDGADDIPVVDLVVNIEPKQSGSGDPSPSNIRPITGWTGCNVTRTGKNLLNPNIHYGLLALTVGSSETSITSSRRYGYSDRIPSENALMFSAVPTDYNVFNYAKILQYVDGIVVWASNNANFSDNTTQKTIAVPARADSYIRIVFGSTASVNDVGSVISANAQAELGSTATAYEPYQGTTLTVDWTTEAGTVYGGTVDIATGLLTVDRAYALLNDASQWREVSGNPKYRYSTEFADRKKYNNSYDGLSACSYIQINATEYTNTGRWVSSSSNNFGIESSGLTLAQIQQDATDGKIAIVYELATPQTYQLSGQQLMTLLGTNNVWTDTGNVSVTYPCDTKMFIEKLTMPTEDDLVANQAITSGKYFMIGNSLYLALANIASGAQITIGTNAQRVSLADALNTINS